MSNNKKVTKTRGPKDGNPKKFKKKTSVLVTEKVEYIDYKDVNLLTRFVSDRSKIRTRRVSGNSVQQQREIANAIKNAREMALLPYTKRVTSTRAPRPGREGREDESTLEMPEQPITSEFANVNEDAENVTETAAEAVATEVEA